ncbi:hypothetical protein D8674_036806 [Pyrus ussuriensis x Pyrus communis]|uniref:Uncharacterized protein n=1 Tax=Pyrus ussuriensis x Pyrus communis TaxID=2448454 RepID=A0A5N5EUS1_9ROSA|nr:hypothetical protein D8674_036806 [Pyrus ussuriensis x Pyrus communis]
MVLVYGTLCEGQDEEKDDDKRPKNLTCDRIHDLPENLCHSSDHKVRGNAEKKRLLKRCLDQDFPVYPNLQVQGGKIKPFSLSCLISVKTYRQNGGPHSILRWKKQKYARRRSFCLSLILSLTPS